MKTQDAIDRAGSAKALADLFEITPSAISQWGDDVPGGRYWQLRVLKPEWFEESAVETPTYSGPNRRKPDPDRRTPRRPANDHDAKVVRHG